MSDETEPVLDEIINTAKESNEELDKTSLSVEGKIKRPSKTVKKRIKYAKKLEDYRIKKQQKKLDRKQKALDKIQNNVTKTTENPSDNETINVNSETIPTTNTAETPTVKKHKIKRFQRANINEKLRKAHENNFDENLKVCIDCSYCSLMSEKEQSRLAQQIGHCYASNRAAATPAQITLTNIDKESFFYKEMCRVNDGFERYYFIKSEKSIEEIHSNNLDNLCYLSPDSEQVLERLDFKKVYIIGGLVDETVTKKVTFTKSNDLKLNCYRLPIEKYMVRRSNETDKKYNYNKILALNHVLDILLNLTVTNDWKDALARCVPARKGFYVQDTEK
jgi:tRNA (guanine9-N1)-methyltransferase